MGVYFALAGINNTACSSSGGEFSTGKYKSRKLDDKQKQADRHVEYLANQRKGNDAHLWLCYFGGCGARVPRMPLDNAGNGSARFQ